MQYITLSQKYNKKKKKKICDVTINYKISSEIH